MERCLSRWRPAIGCPSACSWSGLTGAVVSRETRHLDGGIASKCGDGLDGNVESEEEKATIFPLNANNSPSLLLSFFLSVPSLSLFALLL